MTTFFLSLLSSLVFTLGAEAAVVFALTRRKDFLLSSFLLNALTNPLLNSLLVFPLHFFGTAGYVVCAVLGELCVFLGEAYLYRLFTLAPVKKCVLVSLAANAASLGIGLLFRAVM